MSKTRPNGNAPTPPARDIIREARRFVQSRAIANERFELAFQKPSMGVVDSAPSSRLAPSAMNSGMK